MKTSNFSIVDEIIQIETFQSIKYAGVFPDGKIYPVIGMALVKAKGIGKIIAGIGLNNDGFFLFEQQADFIGYAEIRDTEEQRALLTKYREKL